MRKSMRTTSGASSAAREMASVPSAAWPTTWRSGSPESMPTIPERTTGWSSTTRRRTRRTSGPDGGHGSGRGGPVEPGVLAEKGPTSFTGAFWPRRRFRHARVHRAPGAGRRSASHRGSPRAIASRSARSPPVLLPRRRRHRRR